MRPSSISAPGKAKGTIVALGSKGAMSSAKTASTTKRRTMAPPTMPTGLSLSSASARSADMRVALGPAAC